MDDTMKKYEHRHLATAQAFGGKSVLPQAQAFGLSWSMAMAGLEDIHNSSWDRTVKNKKTPIATGWQSFPDPNGNQTDVEDQLVVPALALWLMQGSGRREQPPMEQGI